jgi:hypothetical protein
MTQYKTRLVEEAFVAEDALVADGALADFRFLLFASSSSLSNGAANSRLDFGDLPALGALVADGPFLLVLVPNIDFRFLLFASSSSLSNGANSRLDFGDLPALGALVADGPFLLVPNIDFRFLLFIFASSSLLSRANNYPLFLMLASSSLSPVLVLIY